jgi:hypothetical protein
MESIERKESEIRQESIKVRDSVFCRLLRVPHAAYPAAFVFGYGLDVEQHHKTVDI